MIHSYVVGTREGKSDGIEACGSALVMEVPLLLGTFAEFIVVSGGVVSIFSQPGSVRSPSPGLKSVTVSILNHR